MEHGGVRVPEDGDEFVRIDLRFDRAQRRVAAFVCERGAHWIYARVSKGRGGGKEGNGARREREVKGERIRKECCGE